MSAAARLWARSGPAVRSVTERRFLLGAVLAWVLVVYLATGTSPTAGVPVIAGGRPPAGGVAQPVAPLAFGAVGAVGVAPVPAPPEFTPLEPGAFASPPSPPASTALQCPYPIPQKPDPGASPGVILSFISPLLAPGGPFASYALPTLGGIGPLVPVITPLLVVGEPVLNEITPGMSTAITDLVDIETQAGLDGPQSEQYAQEFEPYWVQLLASLQPAETAFTSSTAGQCVILFENALAQASQQFGISLPPLPAIPAGLPPGSGASSAAVGAGTLAVTHSPVAQFVLPWSDGVPADIAQLNRSLAALSVKGSAAVVELVDSPPPGQSVGTTGFADFVAEVVHDLPAAALFQVDVGSSDPAGAAAVADAVHGLAAAGAARQPGQLVGVGLPATVTGGAGPAFWSAFAPSMRGYQADLVDFVAADLTPQAPASLAAGAAEAGATATALRRQWTSIGGVPSSVPILGTVALAGAAPSASSVTAAIRAYEKALAGLGVGFLSIG